MKYAWGLVLCLLCVSLTVNAMTYWPQYDAARVDEGRESLTRLLAELPVKGSKAR